MMFPPISVCKLDPASAFRDAQASARHATRQKLGQGAADLELCEVSSVLGLSHWALWKDEGDDGLAREARVLTVVLIAKQAGGTDRDGMTDESFHDPSGGSRADPQEGEDQISLPEASTAQSQRQGHAPEAEVAADLVQEGWGAADGADRLQMFS